MINLTGYLGKDVSNLLSIPPFEGWTVEKTYEDELDETIINYVFSENGFELRCDGDETISVVFVFPEKMKEDDKKMFDLEFDWSREQILAKFGEPSKSGKARNHPILGRFGPWDRFGFDNYAIRYEYKSENLVVRDVTFMRQDVIP